MSLVEEIYRLTKDFPKEEIYGLSSQMRRASVGIPTNITEGYQRHHTKEYIQFLYIAKSSAAELETLLDISARLNFINSIDCSKTNYLLSEILKMLTAMISKLKSKLITSNTNPYTLNPIPS